MNMRLFFAPAFIFALFISGCTTRASVDYDRTAATKFSNYNCFIIDSREIRSDYQDVMLSPIVDRRIERAITQELQAKEFNHNCAQHDFRVTFNTVTKTVTDIDDLGAMASPLRRHPYLGYTSSSRLYIDQYEEGTFIIDIIDNESKELVWRGAISKRLGWSAPSEAEVQAIVSAILAEFPPTQTKD